MGELVDTLADQYEKSEVAASLDAIKNLCFRFATKSGLTVSIDDVQTPPRRPRSSTVTRRKPTRSRTSSVGASSPTASGGRRKSRSGPTPPTRCA
jgi:DNA-directed RNA polymerase subunit beta'